MANNSRIEWTEATWNPVTGCTKVSPGCKFCYAERMSERLQAMGVANYANGFNVTLHEHMLTRPVQWKKPRLVFVNSMSDLFHEYVSLAFIQKVFAVMREAHWHTFQILTKRAERLAEISPLIDWPSNVWQGVSVESEGYIHRIDLLRQTAAAVKFLSLEPLLGPLDDLNLVGIDWVIVGGESGPRARKMEKAWALSIRDQCIEQNVPFFFKQWGGRNKKSTGRELDGCFHNDMPIRGTTLPDHAL